jgi:hypothetical protein
MPSLLFVQYNTKTAFYKFDGEETGKNSSFLSSKLVLRAGLEPTTICLEGNSNLVQNRQKRPIFGLFSGFFVLKKSKNVIYYHTSSTRYTRRRPK